MSKVPGAHGPVAGIISGTGAPSRGCYNYCMRHPVIVAGLLAAALAAVGGLALAKHPPPKVAGEWQVKFTPSANTCGETGLVIADEVMKIKQTAGGISASLPLVSNMTGTVRDGGGF